MKKPTITTLEFVKRLRKKTLTELETGKEENEWVGKMMAHIWLPEIIQALEEKKEWMPVKVGIPRRNRTVLVTLEDAAGKKFTTTAKYYKDIKCWGNFTDARFYNFKVVAWMDKPMPYICEVIR